MASACSGPLRSYRLVPEGNPLTANQGECVPTRSRMDSERFSAIPNKPRLPWHVKGVKRSSNILKKIIICTDFDGTLVHPSFGGLAPGLAKELERLERGGAAVAINTGRSLPDLSLAMSAYRVPFRPPYLITREFEIYREDRANGWSGFEPWNSRCLDVHVRFYEDYADLWRELRRVIKATPGAAPVEEAGALAGALARDYPTVLHLCRFIELTKSQFPKIQYYCNGLYVRFGHLDYNKGTSLAELSRQLGVGPADVFAAGDNHNDLPMLFGGPAHRVACPSNAVPMVKAAVNRASGFVADLPAGGGLLQALRHYFGNEDSPAGSK